jgi:hypothetical protein
MFGSVRCLFELCFCERLTKPTGLGMVSIFLNYAFRLGELVDA